MSILRQLARNIASNWAVLLINIAISFFLAPFVVHKLGNVYYGIWSIILQFTGYLYLMDFGVRESIVRYTSRLSAKGSNKILNQIISTAIIIYSGIAFLCLVAAIIVTWIFPFIFNVPEELLYEVRIVVLLSGATIAQAFVFNVFNGIIMGLQSHYVANLAHMIMAFIRLGLIYIFLEAGYKIVALASIQFAIGLVVGLTLLISALYLLKKSNVAFRFTYMKKKRFIAHARHIFNYSIFVFINVIGLKIIFATDAIVIGIFLNIADVTFYAIAGNLAEYLRKLVASTSSVINPLTSHLNALNKDEKIKLVLTAGSRLCLFIGFPIAITYILLGKEFIGIWMGSEYADRSGVVLLFLGITQLVTFHQYALRMVLFGLSRHNILAYWRIFEAVANLVLSIILVQHYGLIGVALGTAIPHIFFAVFILPVIACKAIQIQIWSFWKEVYLRAIISVAPFVMALLWVKHNLILGSLLEFFIVITLLSCLYVVIAFFIMLLPDERTRILNFVKKK